MPWWGEDFSQPRLEIILAKFSMVQTKRLKESAELEMEVTRINQIPFFLPPSVVSGKKSLCQNSGDFGKSTQRQAIRGTPHDTARRQCSTQHSLTASIKSNTGGKL